MPTLLPAELERWQSVESVIKGILSAYAFKEIRTPLLERTELFQRTIGEQTDVVSKEMYSFLDRKDQSQMDPNTTFVSCMHINNETGAVNDIANIGRYCRKNEIIFHVDAAQSVGKIPIDVNDMC